MNLNELPKATVKLGKKENSLRLQVLLVLIIHITVVDWLRPGLVLVSLCAVLSCLCPCLSALCCRCCAVAVAVAVVLLLLCCCAVAVVLLRCCYRCYCQSNCTMRATLPHFIEQSSNTELFFSMSFYMLPYRTHDALHTGLLYILGPNNAKTGARCLQILPDLP